MDPSTLARMAGPDGMGPEQYLTPFERIELSRRDIRAVNEGRMTDTAIRERFKFLLTNPEISTRAFEVTHPHMRDYLEGMALAYNMANAGQALYYTRATDVLQTVGGTSSPIARVDLETTIYDQFLREFPGLDSFTRERANGIQHSYVIRSAYNDGATPAVFVTELAKATPTISPYAQVSTPISLGLTERGASYVEYLGVMQSGMSYNGGQSAVDLELQAGAWDIAHLFQSACYQGTALGGHTGDNYGTTQAQSYTGLRLILSTQGEVGGTFAAGNWNTSAANHSYYPVTTTDANFVEYTGGTIADLVNQVCVKIMNLGGRPTAIHLSANAARKLALEAGPLFRYDTGDTNGLTIGSSVDGIQTVAGRLPLVVVPGDSIGTYAAPTQSTMSGQQVEDIFILDTRVISMPYLGPQNPTVIQIPMGVDGSLGMRYLLFWISGFAVKSPLHCGKVRIPVS